MCLRGHCKQASKQGVQEGVWVVSSKKLSAQMQHNGKNGDASPGTTISMSCPPLDEPLCCTVCSCHDASPHHIPEAAGFVFVT